ncbi:MAG: AI-2E family transporter [Candidatus Microgenomates bacterium]|jgi:predicted PurR-regulated permease PerM
MYRKIEVSHKTIIFTVLFLLALWLLYLIRDIILTLFVSLLLMAILDPLVNRLAKYKIPRGLSILVCYIVIVGLFVLAIAGVIPPLVEQTTSFVTNLPTYLNHLGINKFLSDQITSQFITQVGSLPGQIVKIGVSVFSNIFSVLSVLMLTFYFLIARNKLDDQLVFLFGQEKREVIGKLIDSLENRLGGWARGELALMLTVGVAYFLGLILLGIPFALPLAILAGLLEIVPYFGPIISAVPAIIIGLSISPIMGLAVVALAILVHQTENYVFVPKIMEKSVGVPPIATLIALTIGFRLLGVVGALISVPVVLTVQIVLKNYLPAK